MNVLRGYVSIKKKERERARKEKENRPTTAQWIREMCEIF